MRDDVARAETGSIRRTIALKGRQQHAIEALNIRIKVVLFGVGVIVLNDTSAKYGALYDAVLDKIRKNLARNIDRHSKGIACVRACSRQNSRVDAYQFSFPVDERTAGVSRINRSIGLDK